MTLEYVPTQFIIDLVLEVMPAQAADKVNMALKKMDRTRPEFYEGVIKHGPFMTYTSAQWLDFHRKVPHWRLRAAKALMDKLSPRHREVLEG